MNETKIHWLCLVGGLQIFVPFCLFVSLKFSAIRITALYNNEKKIRINKI